MNGILKKATFFAFALLSVTIGNSQTLERQVIGAAGGFGAPAGGPQLYYNIGETFVSTLQGGGYTLYEGFEQSVNYSPLFVHGDSQTLSLCQNSSPITVDELLKIYDIDQGQLTRIYVVTLPTTGTITGSYSSVSMNDTLMPSGFTFTPQLDFSGTDSFKVAVSDGIDSSITIIYVNVLSVPLVAAISGATTVCIGSAISLSNVVPGGSWSAADTSVTSIDNFGVVAGLSLGISTISYTVTNSCGSAYAVHSVTVDPLPVNGSLSDPSSICIGSSISLSGTTTGGTWSSSDSSVATVSNTGVVTAVSTGSSTISYIAANSCGTAVSTTSVTVNALPDAGSITGTTTICPAAASNLSNSVTGGTWSSSDSSVATVNSAGFVTGVSTGSSAISYSVTNSCGMDVSTSEVTISALPDAGSITGGTTVCHAATSNLSNSAAGGSWTSSNSSVATVSSTGILTGVSTGDATISYAVTNSCGTSTSTQSVTVSPMANAGTISGDSSVCAGLNASLSATGTGGVWSSGNSAIASVSSVGIVTGIAAGSTTVSYTVTNSCGSDLATHIITVNPTPDAGTISGMSSVCTGSNTTLSTTGTGGVWSSSNAAIASVSAEGMVNGVSAGDIEISYAVTNSCSTDISTQSITVNSLPSAGSLSGTTTFCAGVESTLSSTIPGGSWSSEDTTVATINNFGVVAGLSAGTSAISYTVVNSCGTDVATAAVTINTVPSSSTISGITTLCPGTTASLFASSVGGTWTSNNANVSIDASTGVITGVSTGTSVVSYTVATDCGSVTDTILITVNGFPLPISGPSTVCGGSTISLANASAGGIWTSSNTKALVNPSTGVVTGVASGAVSIIYTGCGVAVSYPITVLTSPGSISGTASICEGALTTLSSGVTGGAWSITGADVATINTSTRVVTGITAGSAVVSYTLVNTCFSTRTITVNPQPSSMSTPGSVCVGAVVTLSNPVAGGVWTTLSSSKATVSAEGVVYAVGAGTTTVKYSIGTCVSSVPFTVNITPKAITGVNFICEGAATTFANTVAGGTWSTSDAGIADINTSSPVGISGVSAGAAAISYTIGSCSVSRAITVNTAPAAMTAPAPVCVGNVVTLSNPVAGGVWTTLSSSKATVSAEGVIYAVGAGTTTVKYSIGTCISSVPFTVNITPKAITGINSICEGAATTFANTVAGGVWSTSDAGIATVSAVAPVTVSGISDGVATIFYTIGSCAATRDVTVKVLPEAMVAPVPACVGAAVTLSNATPGGLWSSSSPTRATVSSVGVVQAISAGVSTIKYTLNGCVSSVPFTVSPTPTGISGLNTVCRGSSVTWTPNIAGGAWTTANAAIATVNSGLTNVMTGVAAGTTTITYTLGSCFTTKVLNVGSCGAKEDDEATGNGVELAGNIINVSIFPNPATSKINIKASVPVNVKLITPDGKLVMTQTDAHELAVDNLASGVYMIMVYDESGVLLKVERLVKVE